MEESSRESSSSPQICEPGPSSSHSTIRGSGSNRSSSTPPSPSPLNDIEPIPEIMSLMKAATPSTPHHHLDTDPKVVDLVTRMFLSQGIPMSTITEPSFIELIKHLNPSIILPTETAMAKKLEKECKHPKPLVNFTKCIGPLTVTVDVGREKDEKSLAFSIHYFDEIYERKNVVYLKKLLLSEVDPESIFISIRRAVNSYSYSNVKFGSLVCPDEEVYQMLSSSNICKRYFVCFNYFMTKFVTDILEIEILMNALESMREFIRFMKNNAQVYGNYRRQQLTKNGDLNLPRLDDRTWYSTTAFLTKFLVLHDDINEFCDRIQRPAPISNEIFIQLYYFQRLLDECLKLSRELSQPNNSVSQVVPAVASLRNFIYGEENQFQSVIRDSFTRSFREVLRGNKYDLAVLMDPRYAYRTEIFSEEKWETLESKACEEFVVLDETASRWFYKDISIMEDQEKYDAIRADFDIYRGRLQKERPEVTASPNYFWGSCYESVMHWLPILAQEYIAPPASVIDISAHFNKGKGKFDRLAKVCSRPTLEECLSVAGSYQPYRGKGFLREKNRVTEEQMNQLTTTANRILKRGLTATTTMEPKTEIPEEKPDNVLFPLNEQKAEFPVVPVKRGRGILRR